MKYLIFIIGLICGWMLNRLTWSLTFILRDIVVIAIVIGLAYVALKFIKPKKE